MKPYKTILNLLFFSLVISGDPSVAGEIVGWGKNSFFRFPDIPLTGFVTGLVEVVGTDSPDIVAVSAAGRGLALNENGRVSGWLRDWGGVPGPPQDLRNVIAISASSRHGMALKADGTVEVWGDSTSGKTTPPPGLNSVAAVSAGFEHCLALRRDGTLLGWGKTQVPSGLTNLVALAASQSWGGRDLAVMNNGTVVQWDNRVGTTQSVTGLSNVVAVASGAVHCLALKSDGTVHGWGFNSHGEATGNPTENPPYTSTGLVTINGSVLSNIVAIAANGTTFPAGGYSLALKSDGTLVAWGKGWSSQTDTPAGLSNVVAISAGETYCLAITTNAAVAERFRR